MARSSSYRVKGGGRVVSGSNGRRAYIRNAVYGAAGFGARMLAKTPFGAKMGMAYRALPASTQSAVKGAFTSLLGVTIPKFIDNLTKSSGNGNASKDKSVPLRGTEGMVLAGGITESTYHSKHPMSSRYKSLLNAAGRYTYKTNYNYSMIGTLNTQVISDMGESVGALGPTVPPTVHDLNPVNRNIGILYGIPDGTSSATIYSSFDSMINYLRSYIAGGTTIPSLNYFLKSVKVTTKIANNSLFKAVVTLSNCTAKRDITQIQLDSPTRAWSNGMGIVGGSLVAPTSGISPYNACALVSTPFDSDLFKSYWDISSSQKFNMQAGAVHVHETKIDYNQMISSVAFAYNRCIAGLSRNIMITAYGTPVYDNTNIAEVGTQKIYINVTHDITYEYFAIANNVKSNNSDFLYDAIVATDVRGANEEVEINS